MNLFSWLREGTHPGPGQALLAPWAWATIVLSVVVVVGYGVIALNWYFQSRLADRGQSRAAPRRLRGIVLSSLVCGFAFYTTEMSWRGWRLYDTVLALLAVWTWSFVLRTQGLGFVRERLALLGELERSARKFREIAEFLPHIVWTATADGRVDFANRTWVAYAGEGRTWLEAVHPEERPDAAAWWRQVVAAGGGDRPAEVGLSPATREVRLGATAGVYRTFLVSVSPVVRGQTVKWLGACVDVEDQKQLAAEKELQARQKMFLLNALSHDLRAPLNNVTLNAHLLKMSARDEADVEVADLIVENAVAAGDMVTNLLEFARMGAQERNAVERVPVAATIQQVVRRFQPVAEKKGLLLSAATADCAAADLRVETDRLKLERVLSNLIDNAIKYTEHGGVTVECSQQAAGAEGGVGGGIVVCVTDTGIGVPATHVPHLFDEFYQVGNHERDRSKGFGMGLAICRCLAQQLGGDVRLARTGPTGSCFELVLSGGASGVRARRRGRPGGAAGDHADPQPAGLCAA